MLDAFIAIAVPIAQEAPSSRTLLDRFAPLAILILAGIVILAAVLWGLRGQQTPAEKMPRAQRWLLIGLVGLLVGAVLILLLANVLR